MTKKLNKQFGKFLSLILSVAMLVTALPANLLGGILSVQAADTYRTVGASWTESSAEGMIGKLERTTTWDFSDVAEDGSALKADDELEGIKIKAGKAQVKKTALNSAQTSVVYESFSLNKESNDSTTSGEIVLPLDENTTDVKLQFTLVSANTARSLVIGTDAVNDTVSQNKSAEEGHHVTAGIGFDVTLKASDGVTDVKSTITPLTYEATYDSTYLSTDGLHIKTKGTAGASEEAKFGSIVITEYKVSDSDPEGTQEGTHTGTGEGEEKAAAPTADLAQDKEYTEAITVKLSSTTDGADIYYTLDETDPTTSSTKYTADGIKLEGKSGEKTTYTIKAIAAKTGRTNSSVSTFTYVVNLASDGKVTKHYTFSAPDDVAFTKDNDVIPQSTKLGPQKYFEVWVADGTILPEGEESGTTGKVTMRGSGTTTKNIQIEKWSSAGIVFTVKGTAKATFNVCSTGGSNTSTVALMKEDGTYAKAASATGTDADMTREDNIVIVKGNDKTEVVYENLTAGTYTLLSPYVKNQNRGMKLYDAAVDDTITAQIMKVKYTFNAPDDVTFSKDNDVIPQSTKLGPQKYFEVWVADGTILPEGEETGTTGKVTMRGSGTTTKNIQIEKWSSAGIVFTVKGTAKATFNVCSTGGSNTSTVALMKEDGTYAKAASATGTDADMTREDNIVIVKGNDKTEVVYENLTAGTYTLLSPYVKNQNRGMKLYDAMVEDETVVEVVTTEYTFNAPDDVTFTKDNDVIPQSTKLGPQKYFEVWVADGTILPEGEESGTTGKVTMRGSGTTTKNIQIEKWSSAGIVFTVKGTAKAVFNVCSTGGSNTSTVALMMEDGTYVKAASATGTDADMTREDNIVIVKGNDKTEVVYENLAAGTYTLLSPYVKNQNRGMKLYDAKVTDTYASSGDDEIEDVVRGPWDDVEAPVIVSYGLSDYNDGIVAVVVKALVNTDGGDSVTVDFIEEDGVTVAATNTNAGQTIPTALEKETEVTPTKSGTYRIRATLSRAGEVDKVSELTEPFEFNLPLKTPSFASLTNKGTESGKGKLELIWNKTTEATNYEIEVNEILASNVLTVSDVTEFAKGASIPADTKFADFFTVTGGAITMKDTSYFELPQKAGGGLTFTVPENTASVAFTVASTGGANLSNAALKDAEGNLVSGVKFYNSANNGKVVNDNIALVYGTGATVLRYMKLPAGTYTLFVPESAEGLAPDRGLRVSKVEVYQVPEKATASASQKKLEVTLGGLPVDKKVLASVIATRGNDQSCAAVKVVNITGNNDRTWGFTVYGDNTSTDEDKSGYTVDEETGELKTLWNAGGKGKIVPESNKDGLSFYYTKIDPKTENFVLTADIHVDKWTYSNGQDGFGLMVADRLGEYGNTASIWNNSLQLVASKMQYYWDNRLNDGVGGITTATPDNINIFRYEMKIGIGYNLKTGVTASEVQRIEGAGLATEVPSGFTATAYKTLEQSVAERQQAAQSWVGGSYNIIGNFTADPGGSQPNLITDVKYQIQRNNTGYILRYLDMTATEEAADGKTIVAVDGKNYKVLNSKTVYDLDRNIMTQIDNENMYIGFIAARNFNISVSNIVIDVHDPSKDPEAEEQETEIVELNDRVLSAEVSNSDYYEFMFSSNRKGTLSIVNSTTGQLVVSGASITANKRYTVGLTLVDGDNVLDYKFVPDPTYVPGEYKAMSSYEAVTGSYTVSYHKLQGGKNPIYVSPSGKLDTANLAAAGSKENPVDVFSAVAYAQEGQSIYLMAEAGKETYMIKDIANALGRADAEDQILIARGHDGTPKNMITMQTEPEDYAAGRRAVLDFKGQVKTDAAFVIVGNYWHFLGFDVTHSQDARSGIQVCGSYNLVEDMKTYENGNTGIYVARYSNDGRELWPSYNTILNCTSYMNFDAGFEDADGYACKLTAGDGNKFVGCVAAYNADDGWDLFAKVQSGTIGVVTIENCVAYKNGYLLGTKGSGDTPTKINYSGKEFAAGNGNGFKMGGESMTGYHVLRNSVTFMNKSKGIDSNSCPDDQIYDSISFNNEDSNISLYTNNAGNTDYMVQNVLSYRDSNSNGKTADKFELRGTQVVSKVTDNGTFSWNGSSSANFVNYKLNGASATSKKADVDYVTVADDWFESLKLADSGINPAKKIFIARKADGSIDLGSFLKVTDKAREASGNPNVGGNIDNVDTEALAGTPEIYVYATKGSKNVTTLADVAAKVKKLENNPIDGYSFKYPETTVDSFIGTSGEFAIINADKTKEKTVLVHFLDVAGVELTVADAAGDEVYPGDVKLVGSNTLTLQARPVYLPDVEIPDNAAVIGNAKFVYDVKEASRLGLTVADAKDADGKTIAGQKVISRSSAAKDGLAKISATMTATVGAKTVRFTNYLSFTTRAVDYVFSFTTDGEDVFVTKGADGETASIYGGKNAKTFAIKDLKVTNADGSGKGPGNKTDVKVTVSDSRILKVTGSGNAYNFTVVSPGTAIITLTAAGDKTVVKNIPVTVGGIGFKVGVTTIDVNKALVAGTQITTKGLNGYTIDTAAETPVRVKTVMQGKTAKSNLTKYFSVTHVIGGIYSIATVNKVPTELPNGTYQVTLEGKVAGAEEYVAFEPITIRVIETRPVVSVKQAKKVNLFYVETSANGKGALKATSKQGTVSLKQLNASASDYTLSGANGSYTVKLKKSSQAIINRTAKITNPVVEVVTSVAGYKDIDAYKRTLKIRIGTVTQRPKLQITAENSVFYTQLGIDSTALHVYDRSTKAEMTGIKIKLADSRSSYVSANRAFEYDEDEGLLTAKKSGSAKISVQNVAEWTQEMVLNVPIKVVNTQPRVIFAPVRINGEDAYATYEQTSTAITVRNALDYDIAITAMKGTNAKAETFKKYLSCTTDADDEGNHVLLTTLTSKLPANTRGSYSYKATVVLTGANKKSVTLNNVAIRFSITPKAVATTRMSGKIDLVNRTGSAIYMKPTVRNLTGTVVGMYFGDDSSINTRSKAEYGAGSLFNVEWDSTKERAAVTAIDGASYRMNGRYKVVPVYIISTPNGEVELASRPVVITTRQSNVKLDTIPTLEVRLSDADTPAFANTYVKSPSNAELLGMTQLTQLENFDVQYIASGGVLFVYIKDANGLKANKTYTIKMGLEPYGAGAGSRQQTISLRVKVVN